MRQFVTAVAIWMSLASGAWAEEVYDPPSLHVEQEGRLVDTEEFDGFYTWTCEGRDGGWSVECEGAVT